MRRAFADTLTSLAEKDPRLVFLTGDLGFQMFDDFKTKFGPRYINVGIAEAQMVCAAAGLALEGFRPVIYSIASFATRRPFEQIRVSVAYQELPVIIVGAGGGYCYSTSGPTHHAADDLALMSLIPGMTVVAPGDPNEVRELMPQLFQLEGPAYIRIGKFGEPVYKAEHPSILGKARLLRDGEKVAVVTSGEMASITLRAMDELHGEGIKPFLYQFHTIKPLDSATLDDLANCASTIIIVEESTPVGGLGASIMSWYSASDVVPKLMRLGPPDVTVLGNPQRNTLRRQYRYDEEAIKAVCRQAWKDGYR